MHFQRVRWMLSLLVCACMVGAAEGGAILDQTFDPTYMYNQSSDIRGGTDYAEEAQVFRVGIDGRLTGANLFLQGYSPISLLLQVRRLDASGLPSMAPSGVLAAATTSLGTWTPLGMVAFDFGKDGPLVHAGDRLALVLLSNDSGPGGMAGWFGASYSPYSATGPMLTRAPYYRDVWSPPVGLDGAGLGFQTFVTPVPEPSTWLVGAGAGAFAWRHRRRGATRKTLA